MDVSENSGTPKSSILIGFSIINHPFWDTPIFGNTLIGRDICARFRRRTLFIVQGYDCRPDEPEKM